MFYNSSCDIPGFLALTVRDLVKEDREHQIDLAFHRFRAPPKPEIQTVLSCHRLITGLVMTCGRRRHVSISDSPLVRRCETWEFEKMPLSEVRSVCKGVLGMLCFACSSPPLA